MRLNLTAKDIGHTDLVDEATGDVQYTIRTNIDGKMKTVRRPLQEPAPDHAPGPLVGRFHLHTVTADTMERREGEQIHVKDWMHDENKESAYTSQSGKKYAWSMQKDGDAILHDESGQQVAYLYERSSSLFNKEKRERACLEVSDDMMADFDDIVLSCLYLKIRGQHAGVFGTSLSHKLAVAMSSGTGLST
ncbi:unnamed protein product [Peniophora sp. CBMAI 1063]|nr:unnamed protein product [Peniophora sp. CBMAI 1063]